MWVSEILFVDVTPRFRGFPSLQDQKLEDPARVEVNIAPPTQGKGSPWEMASNQSWRPTRLKAPRQPRPDPAPGQPRGSEEGPGRAVPSGSVPRARGRGRSLSTSPLRVTNGLGTQAHATFQPRAGLKRADTPHSTPAKAGQGGGAGGLGLPPATAGHSHAPNRRSSQPNLDVRPSPALGGGVRRGWPGS